MKNLICIAILSVLFLIGCKKDNPVEPVDPNLVSLYVVTLDELNSYGGNTQTVQEKAKSITNDNGIDNSMIKFVYSKAVRGFTALLTPVEVDRLSKDPRIYEVNKDKEYTLDSWVDNIQPKGNQIQVQTVPWGISSVNYGVGGVTEATSTTGVCWIVDTGIDLDHPDLKVNTTLSKTFVTTAPDNTNADDNNGHGTHVAGIVGAKNNDFGTVGVCSNAELISIKVMNYRGAGMVSDIIKGLEYIANNLVPNRINVVNLSLGGSADNSLDTAVVRLARAGAYVVIAAGNSSVNASTVSPCRVNGTRIWTISAHTSTGQFASFSNFGNPPIDYSAPGQLIYSTYKAGGYATLSGTSMSAPYVSGILLVNNGIIHTNGVVTYDRDATPDSIAHK